MAFTPLQRLVERFRDGPRDGPRDDVPEVVYFGDSVLERVSDHDTDKTPLGALVGARLPRRNVVLSAPAYCTVNFADYARVLCAMPHRPRLVIVHVNVRCLSPQWTANPDYLRLDHRAAVRSFLEDPAGPVPPRPVLDIDTAALRAGARALRVTSPFTGETTVGALEDARDTTPRNDAESRERGRLLVAYHYGLPFAADHACLQALGQMVATLRAGGMRMLAYATPVNVDFAGRLGGDALLATIAGKVAAFEAVVAGAAPGDPAVAFHDLHALCPAERFLHRGYLVEHLDQHGRSALADAIVERAERLLAVC